ncbi:heme-binding protein [Variovorax gossypii]|uniref:Heme-binding protein n=1 Tax=Variovorax gossypii TaxID=1679495 RepID=A0A431THT1_9BURK|nr:heme-binding protein [Variovorax gossypii]
MNERKGKPVSSLTLQQARTIIDAALAKSKEAGYQPMGIAVLDAAGHLKAFVSEDGASMFRFDIARAKAWGAVGMGVASRKLAERARDNPNFFVALAATAEGRFLPQTGAVVIRDAAGTLLGAVGASGGTGDEDEAICIAGVQAAGLSAG